MCAGLDETGRERIPLYNTRDGRKIESLRPTPSLSFLSRTKVPNLAFWEMARKMRSL